MTLFETIQPASIDWQTGFPRSTQFDDIYCSLDNPLGESEAVFIAGNQLASRWQALSTQQSATFVIAETGFGAGLNFLVAWASWKKNAPADAFLQFVSSEKHPMTPTDLARFLALFPTLQHESTALLAAYPPLSPGLHALIFEEGRVILTLMFGDVLTTYRALLASGDATLESVSRHWHVDAWFLDGFTPSKNPDMWESDLFETMALLSDETTTCATYSAAGIVRRGLTAVGFQMTIRPGYGRKREMLAGVWRGARLKHTYPRETPWHVSPKQRHQHKHAIIVGAGLAGCATAAALAHRGWRVTLIDAGGGVGRGASGNRRAILYPLLSAHQSLMSDFMLNAWYFAQSFYTSFLDGDVGVWTGLLQLQSVEPALEDFLRSNPSLGVVVDSVEASALAGISVRSGGIWIKSAGCFDSVAVCERLIQSPYITFVPDVRVGHLEKTTYGWSIGTYDAPVVVLAMGPATNSFVQTTELPLRPVYGQMTSLQSNALSASLRVPLCADGHVLPARDGVHAVGATYHPDVLNRECLDADNLCNIRLLNAISSHPIWSDKCVSAWAGIRAVTPDYLPLVGPAPDVGTFKARFASFSLDSRRFIPECGAYHPGLFVCAGFGSRGLLSIPMSATWLSDMIAETPLIAPRKALQAVSPARFLRRSIMKSTA